MANITDIDRLLPPAAAVCRTWLHICRDDLHIDARIVETLRPTDRQKELARQGKSDVKLGWHNVGLAWDYLCFDKDGGVIHDGDHPSYTSCGMVAKTLGCKWPIHLRSGAKDAGHIEYHPGVIFADYLAADDSERERMLGVAPAPAPAAQPGSNKFMDILRFFLGRKN